MTDDEHERTVSAQPVDTGCALGHQALGHLALVPRQAAGRRSDELAHRAALGGDPAVVRARRAAGSGVGNRS